MMLMFYTDINECLISNGGCEFFCTNLEGINNRTGLGYQCGCDDGYQLAPNNHDCIGMYKRIYTYNKTILITHLLIKSVYILTLKCQKY